MATRSPEDVLRGYFEEMHEWEDNCFFKASLCKNSEERDIFWRGEVARLTAIWNKWCYGPYPHGDRGRAVGDPTEYGDREKIENCEILKDRATVVTSDSNTMQSPSWKTVYSLKLVDGEWRIATRHSIMKDGKKRKEKL